MNSLTFRNLIITFLLFGVVSMPSTFAAQAPHLGQRLGSLSGMDNVYVVVAIESTAEHLGVVEELLRSKIKDRLEQSKIKVIDETQIDATDPDGVLMATANARCGKKKLCAYAVDLRLEQVVTLARDPKIRESAVTWSEGGVALTEEEDVSEGIYLSMGQLTGRFASQYRKVNPFQQKETNLSVKRVDVSGQ
jgi:hypothetical protein